MISIPVTSSPLIAAIIGFSTVSPLAGIPLALLVVGFLIPHLVRSARLPRVSTWLLLFFAVALVSSMAAIFREIYPGLEQNVPGRVFRALLTLGVGTSFYLVVGTFVRSDKDANRVLKWLYVGGAAMMLWASIQAFYVIRSGGIPGEFQNIHRIFSIYDTPRNRLAGFAYEPSWLGDQLVILYLPLLLTSVLLGYSAFTKRKTRFSVELFLLLWGTAILARQRDRRQGSIELMLCVLAPLAGLVYVLSNPNHLRYAVPLLAFSSGLVVIGTASLLRRWVLAAVVIAIAASCWQVLPAASRYRTEDSPPVAAVEYAFRRARANGWVVVADRTLTAFVELERGLRPFSGTVLYDHQIEFGETAPPPDWATVFVFDDGHGGLLVRADERRRLVCDQPLFRHLGQDRFLDLTVAEGAALRAVR